MACTRSWSTIRLAMTRPYSPLPVSTRECLWRSGMITLGSLKHRQQQCSKHSTPNQAVGKDGRSGSRRNGGVSLEQETPSGGDGQDLDAGPVKISVSEMDKPDYIDMCVFRRFLSALWVDHIRRRADLIMSGKRYKDVVAGTEFDNLDPATEESMEETRRRLLALQENRLEEYLLSRGETELLEKLKAINPKAREKVPQDEPDLKEQQYVEMAQGDWAEVLVHTDRVQKTVKGGMEVSYRALVVVGNLNGAGGFAIGKASNPGDAILEASRKAKLSKNLVYVERFKQACLFQDVVGKHNGCKAYIWARPPGYGMRSSGLMRQILYNIGITDAGCKIVGNRNKYSMIYAVFSALAKHRGLETISKFASPTKYYFITFGAYPDGCTLLSILKD